MALNSEQKDALAKEMRDYKQQMMVTSEKAHVEEKNRYGNINRLINMNRIDEEIFNEAAAKEREAHEAECRKDERLAQELVKMKEEEECRMKKRQHLRENCHELKKLESQLRNAYLSKALAAQIAEKEAETFASKVRQKEAYDYMMSQKYELTKIAQMEAERDLQRKLEYRKELQDQMIFAEKSKRFKFEEFLKEKKLLDDVIQRIQDENERQRQQKINNMIKTNQEMMAFKAAQQLWKEKEMEALAEENRKIQEFIQSKKSGAAAAKELKEQQEAMKAKAAEKVARGLADIRAKQKEREEIMQELLEEEEKESAIRKQKEEQERMMRKRAEVRESHYMQMAEKMERKKKEAEEDAKYMEELMKSMAEDERLEQLSKEKRRIKMMQIRKDIQEMMIERKQKRAEEIQFLIQKMEEEAEEERKRREIIEEERLRMLKEHAPNLVGYIPKGVLRKEDLERLGEELKGYLPKK